MFILRAFLSGKDGVLIGGCWPGECHYITEGNYLALSTVHLCRKLLELIGINPERVRLEWVSASEGARYAEAMSDFSRKVRGLGPIGRGEGIDPDELTRRLETLQQLVPYIKLVERERLRVSLKSVEAYNDFFAGDEFNRLFKDLIADKVTISRMMALLREKPRSAGELSAMSGVSPSEVSRHLNTSARQGLGRFDGRRGVISASLKETEGLDADGEERPAAETGALAGERIERILSVHQGKPGALIHVLMEIQSENKWLSKEILDEISRRLEVPLSRVMQIASFYKTFSLTPKGRHEIHVCAGASCHLRGSSDLLNAVQDLIGIRTGETDAASNFSLENGNCLGCCTLGPEIMIDGRHHGRITPAEVDAVLKTVA